MTRRPYDPAAFRAFERDGWNDLHSGYHRQWRHLTTQAIPALLEAAGVGPGKRVLDVACGPGYVSAAAAARGAATIGLDLSERMIELAARTCPGLAFRTGDAEALPFPEATFDAVLINFGILHFPDAERALAEAHRVLRPGGRLAFTAWDGPEGSAIGIATEAIRKAGSLHVDMPTGTPVFRFAERDECRRVLSRLGFRDIDSAGMRLTWRLAATESLMESFRQSTARMSGLLRAQDPEALPGIAAAMREACRPFERAGVIELPMPALLTSATKA